MAVPGRVLGNREGISGQYFHVIGPEQSQEARLLPTGAAVFVTGGSGVVGSALIRHLVAGGVRPRALSRSRRSDQVLTSLGADPVRGDVLDESSLRAALEGVELVFAVAGINELCIRDPSLMYQVNVTGSANTVRAAAAGGARRLVFTSSAATLGEERGTVGSETSSHRGWFLSHYERSKYQGEMAVKEAGQGIELVIVNPSSVQGPGRSTGTGKLILDLVNGRLSALVRTRLSLVDIDDCAVGHLLAASRGAPGERYLLNSFTIEMEEAIGVLEEVLERSIPVRYLPGWVASAGAAIVEGGFRAVRKRPPVCREMVRALRYGHAYDGSKAARELGFDYTQPEDLLRRLIEWYRSEGMLT